VIVIVSDLSNGAISSDLEWSVKVTPIFDAEYCH